MSKNKRAGRARLMTFTGSFPVEIPGWGVAQPGQSYEFNEAAFATGRFSLPDNPPAPPAETPQEVTDEDGDR